MTSSKRTPAAFNIDDNVVDSIFSLRGTRTTDPSMVLTRIMVRLPLLAAVIICTETKNAIDLQMDFMLTIILGSNNLTGELTSKIKS